MPINIRCIKSGCLRKKNGGEECNSGYCRSSYRLCDAKSDHELSKNYNNNDKLSQAIHNSAKILSEAIVNIKKELSDTCKLNTLNEGDLGTIEVKIRSKLINDIPSVTNGNIIQFRHNIGSIVMDNDKLLWKIEIKELKNLFFEE